MKRKKPVTPLMPEQKLARSQKRKANMLATELTKQRFYSYLKITIYLHRKRKRFLHNRESSEPTIFGDATVLR